MEYVVSETKHGGTISTLTCAGAYVMLDFPERETYTEIIDLDVPQAMRGQKLSLLLIKQAAITARTRNRYQLRIKAHNERALSAVRHVIIESSVKIINYDLDTITTLSAKGLSAAIKALADCRQVLQDYGVGESDMLGVYVTLQACLRDTF